MMDVSAARLLREACVPFVGIIGPASLRLMYTLAIISHKGGTGKTMIACSLAVAAQNHGFESVIFDADPLQPASFWASQRKKHAPAVIPIRARDMIGDFMSAHAVSAQLGIIDTAPHVIDGASRAAYAAQFVLIPCRPGVPDLAATGATVRIVRQLATPAAVVLNAAGIRSPVVPVIREVLEDNGVEVAPVLRQRVIHTYAIAQGLTALELESTSKAAQEIETLWKWLLPKLRGKC